MEESKKLKHHLSSFRIIVSGFAGVVLLGAILLMLPLSSSSGQATSFGDALFTSTSAVCVTGLVVQDTATYWSVFGQAVILTLIQIGGLGVVTVSVAFALFSGRKISLMQRSTLQEAISAPGVGGIVRLTGFILKAIFLFEIIGALAMMPVFCKDFGAKGIWMALFHSVSAFCNAGFDILGNKTSLFPSFTGYAGNTLINIVLMLLIVIGGIGFLTWEDIAANKFRFRKYRMQSKVILVTTLVLILVPAVFFFFVELSGLPLKERLLGSAFQSITLRTAGFNTADMTKMTGAGKAISILMMLIGGSPGSTAGGMKTTTVAVLFVTMLSTFRRKSDTNMFGRRVDLNVIKNAATIMIMYMILFFSGAVIISTIEGLPFSTCAFETASAIGTVGLTLGITPTLGIISRCILMLLMFFGRVGGLTLIFAALSLKNNNISKLPKERITVG